MSSSFFAIIVYVAVLLFVALRGRKQATSSDMFNIFGRKADFWRTTSGYLSLIGAGELVTISQLGFGSGLGAMWFPSGIAAGFLALALFANGVRERAAAIEANTMVGYVAKVYGKSAGTGLLIIYTIALGALLVIQFILGSQLLGAIAGVPPYFVAIGLALVIAAYLIIAGYVAVLSTDVLRLVFLAAFSLIVIILVAIPALFGPENTQVFAPLPTLDGGMLFVLGFFGALCAGDVWQTVLASRSKAVLRASMVSAAIAFLGFGLLIALIGMQAKILLNDQPFDGVALVLATQTVVPYYLTPLFAVLIVGSIMATADTEIWVISTSVVGLSGEFANSTTDDLEPDAVRHRVRIAIPIVTIIAAVLAMITGNAQALYEGLLLLLTAIAPAIIAIMLGAKKVKAITWSIWAGLISFIILYISMSMAVPLHFGFIPMVCAGLVLVVWAVLDKSMHPDALTKA